MMGSFIGIRLPPGLTSKINEFCGALEFPPPPSPYIMLIPPFLSESIPTLRHRLESFCLSQPEFDIRVGPPAIRGNQLLYLAVRGGALVEMRSGLARHLGVVLSAAYTPHIVLVRRSAERRYDLAQLLEKAYRTFPADERVHVAAASLFTQPAPDAPYAPALDVPFTGK